MTHTLVVGNTHDNLNALSQMCSAGHYVMCNEGGPRIHDLIKTMEGRGWASHRPGGAVRQNPQLWRVNRLVAHGKGARQIMRGGRIGLLGMRVSGSVLRRYRGKRLGPSRGASMVYVEDIVDGKRGIYVDFHLNARTFTSERWRLPVFLSSVRNLDVFLNSLAKKYPHTTIIVGGDANSNKRIPLSAKWKQLRTLPDMGRNRYTHLYMYDPTGNAKVSNIREQRNASDHDATVCDVTFG